MCESIKKIKIEQNQSKNSMQYCFKKVIYKQTTLLFKIIIKTFCTLFELLVNNILISFYIGIYMYNPRKI